MREIPVASTSQIAAAARPVLPTCSPAPAHGVSVRLSAALAPTHLAHRPECFRLATVVLCTAKIVPPYIPEATPAAVGACHGPDISTAIVRPWRWMLQARMRIRLRAAMPLLQGMGKRRKCHVYEVNILQQKCRITRLSPGKSHLRRSSGSL